MVRRTVDFRTQASTSQPQPAAPTPAGTRTLYFQIRTVSPIHIGCDEVYEPTAFVVDEKTGELVSFASVSLLELLDSEALKKFSDICAKGSIVSLLELLRFMHAQADLVRDHQLGQRIKVSAAFVEHHQSTLKLPANEHTVKQELNNFQIRRTAFDPLTGKAYIPGSAIKGAIRTAVLNLRNGGRRDPQFTGNGAGRKLQEHVLGFDFHHLESDPFRLLKVSDFFPVNEAARRIVYAVDRKKRPSEREAQAPYQVLEAVEPGTVFAGTVTLLPSPGRDSGIRNPLGMDEVVKAIRSFYGTEKQREDRELGNISVNPPVFPADETTLPLRLGRHSGAECVTVNGHRHIKIMQGKDKPAKHLDHATTVWLAAESKKPTTNQGMKPFGWVAMESLSEEEGLKLLDQASQRKQSVFQIMQARVAAAKQHEAEIIARKEAEKRQAEEREIRLAEEKEAQEAAAEKERQTLAAMTEAELLAYLVTKPDAPESDIVGIYSRIDSFELAEQQTIAAALKQYWESIGKWKVKPKQEKQWKKVQKIKTILGEA